MKTKKTITIEQAIKAGNDGQNQNIKQDFVGKHVYCNVNSLAEYCLSKGFEDPNSPINLDDLENYYSFPEYRNEFADFDGGTEEQKQTEIERLEELRDQYDKDEPTDEEERIYNQIRDEIADLEALESEPQEVFEWWAVSSFLYEQLKERGYVVIDAGSCFVWGRTTTGQAILLDGVITRICADMEILEGQTNSWAKK